jgi:hypothetical protein
VEACLGEHSNWEVVLNHLMMCTLLVESTPLMDLV